MTFKLNKYFYLMLMEKGEVPIPGIGIFSLNRSTAYFNHETGKMSPPSATIEFDHEYGGDGDELLNYISLYEDSPEIYKDAIKSFSNYTLNRLINFGEVEVEKIGTLRRENGQNVKFSPDETTLKVLNPGLAEVLPVLHKSYAASQKPIGNVDFTEPNPFESISNSHQTGKKPWLPFWLIISAILFLLILWKFDSCNRGPQQAKDRQGSLKEAIVNDEPSGKFLQAEIIDEVENFDSEQSPKSTVDESGSVPDSCIIVTGSFKNSKYADMMKKQLEDQGYTAYTEKYGDFTRVGVSFECQEKDFEDSIRNIRNKFAKDAWYLSPELTIYTN
jgi:hypothetical protein